MLNYAQEEAVNYLQGPCLVLAGAGSGKTRVITHKIARLMQVGLEAERIAAITFTNKAATEMRARAKSLSGKASKDLIICTFHALGVRILRQDGTHLGLKSNFSILDSDDVLSIIKDAGGGTDSKLARKWQWGISLWKNQGISPETILEQSRDEEERLQALIMQRYTERLLAYQALDFDDLIGLPLRLLQEHAEVRQRWQQQLGYILVDEYQDTSAQQYELLKLLVGSKGHFTAVGDDDQSIYGWRGATLDNLKRLPQDFTQLKVIKLEQNYRSTNAILRAANNVIGPNPKLFEKKLWSELGEGEPVRIVIADDEDHEAERALARIQSLQSSTPYPEPKHYAILYRANHQSKAFEKVLRKARIPYKVSGGTSFFDRSEIKDLCAWLRLISNEDDDPAFLRAITTPKRGVGHQTLKKLGEYAASHKTSLFEALYAPGLAGHLALRKLEDLREFGRCVNDLEYRARHTQGQEDANTFLTEWLQNIGYERYLLDHSDSPVQAQARWENVLDFCRWIAKRCGGEDDTDLGGIGASEKKNLREVVQTIALLSTLSEGESDDNVITLSTLHAAKGLEWTHVILAGVNEGTLPFSRGEQEEQQDPESNPAPGQAGNPGQSTPASATERIEEERRLMYVGITRARQSLAVSYSKMRMRRGNIQKLEPSRFIGEMALERSTTQENPVEKLKALRAEFAKQAEAIKKAQSQAQ